MELTVDRKSGGSRVLNATVSATSEALLWEVADAYGVTFIEAGRMVFREAAVALIRRAHAVANAGEDILDVLEDLGPQPPDPGADSRDGDLGDVGELR